MSSPQSTCRAPKQRLGNHLNVAGEFTRKIVYHMSASLGAPADSYGTSRILPVAR
jgi:hypothetical protein